MKTKTPKKERAAHLGQQAAPKYYSQGKSYLRPIPTSSLKLRIGELLLFGNKQQKEFWLLFEALLVQSYQGSSQIPVKGRDTALESTKSGNGGIG